MFKRNLKRAITIALSACLMVGAAAGCGKKEENNNTTPAPTQAADNGNTDNNGSGSTDSNGNGGTAPAEATYTYNKALVTFPTNWNFHEYETTYDTEILNYISSGFYVFDYNDTKDGYKLVPGMTVDFPVDVTADYAGQYGIEAGETARVWKMTLRDDLKWEDGTPIKAQDFVTSAKLLLDPVAKNHRADTLYNGSLEVVGAREYLYQGTSTFTPLGVSVSDYLANGGAAENIYVDMSFWGITAADGTNYAAATDDTMVRDEAVAEGQPEDYVSAKYLYETYLGPGCPYESESSAYLGTMVDYAADYSFDNVGVIALSDTELALVLVKPLEGFYLHYALTSSWLVKEDLYNSCITVKDGVYTNNYGTSVETTASYGPYKLTFFQADKEFVLEKNENFYDLTEDTYQTTAIKVTYVAEAATRLEMFLSGQLDSYALQAEDMEEYQSSDYTYYTSEPSTFFIALNPDMDALTANQANVGTNINKTILTVKEFRQALSFALDRSAFALAVSPVNGPAYSLYSDLIISDPENGTSYRSNEEAKQVLVNFWGLANEVGEGKMYATKDEAIDSITGYNLAMAKQYFDLAYDKAVAEGLLDADDTIEIKIGTPNATSNFYNKGYEYLVNCYTEAVVGTKLEGKLTFTKDDTLGNAYGNALRTNKVDMLFGVGWNGSALDPYSLIEAYTHEDYRYNRHWDTSKEMLTVNLNGTDYTASIMDWTKTLAGTEIEIAKADGTKETFKAGSSDGVDALRFQILVALEGAVLDTYEMIPMIDSSSAALKGMQFNYYTEDYIYGVGRHGDYKYMTYNYTDAEWDEFVKSQGGKLNYK